jgi:hypothetical protein
VLRCRPRAVALTRARRWTSRFEGEAASSLLHHLQQTRYSVVGRKSILFVSARPSPCVADGPSCSHEEEGEQGTRDDSHRDQDPRPPRRRRRRLAAPAGRPAPIQSLAQGAALSIRRPTPPRRCCWWGTARPSSGGPPFTTRSRTTISPRSRSRWARSSRSSWKRWAATKLRELAGLTPNRRASLSCCSHTRTMRCRALLPARNLPSPRHRGKAGCGARACASLSRTLGMTVLGCANRSGACAP